MTSRHTKKRDDSLRCMHAKMHTSIHRPKHSKKFLNLFYMHTATDLNESSNAKLKKMHIVFIQTVCCAAASSPFSMAIVDKRSLEPNEHIKHRCPETAALTAVFIAGMEAPSILDRSRSSSSSSSSICRCNSVVVEAIVAVAV